MPLFPTEEFTKKEYEEYVSYWIETGDTLLLVLPFRHFPDTLERSGRIISEVYELFMQRADVWHELSKDEHNNFNSFENFIMNLKKEREMILSALKTNDGITTEKSKRILPEVYELFMQRADIWHELSKDEQNNFNSFENFIMNLEKEYEAIISALKINEGITREVSERILSEVYEFFMQRAESIWHELSKDERNSFHSFEKFMMSLEKEREMILSASKTKDDIDCQYSKILLPFSNNKEMTSIYEDQQSCAEIEFDHKILNAQNTKRDVLFELKGPDNILLLKNLIRTELSNLWYKSTTYELMIIHYFKCNDETHEWLKNKSSFNDLYPFLGLEFQVNGECKTRMRDNTIA